MNLTLFEKIINKEIPADIIYEDEISIVIKDINPQAPTHLLIIPKKVIPKLSNASKEDKDVLGHLMLLAGRIAEELGLDETFRLVVNNGAKAGQSVFHLHLTFAFRKTFKLAARLKIYIRANTER
jgi:histidine triad (HIT) family protein